MPADCAAHRGAGGPHWHCPPSICSHKAAGNSVSCRLGHLGPARKGAELQRTGVEPKLKCMCKINIYFLPQVSGLTITIIRRDITRGEGTKMHQRTGVNAASPAITALPHPNKEPLSRGDFVPTSLSGRIGYNYPPEAQPFSSPDLPLPRPLITATSWGPLSK